MRQGAPGMRHKNPDTYVVASSSWHVSSALKVAPPLPTRALDGSGTAKHNTFGGKRPACCRAASSDSTARAWSSVDAVTTMTVRNSRSAISRAHFASSLRHPAAPNFW